MAVHVVLLRGINVGGRRLPMKDLQRMLEALGCRDVRTYIQSGNVVCRAATGGAKLGERLAAAVDRSCGFAPRVIVLTRDELARAAAGNPYSQAAANPATVHLFFLAGTPKRPDLAGLDALRSATEHFTLAGRVFYVHTPDGFGRSKLAERAERLLGVEATARNWRTVTALLEMAGADAER